MKGLYLNIPNAAALIQCVDHLLGVETCVASAFHGAAGEVVISHHPADWPDGPVFSDPSRELLGASSGWLSFRGKAGDLRALVLALSNAVTDEEKSRVLEDVDGGSFVLLLAQGSHFRIISDPFGLHPHYVRRAPGPVRLAPSPFFLKGAAAADQDQLLILDRMNHLVGDSTAYPDVTRVPPGAIVDRDRAHFYFDYTPTVFEPREIVKDLGSIARSFEGRRRVLPLSGGLDSRLLLATGTFECGFTFGPQDRGDRPIARRFADRFDQGYDEFSLLDLEYPGRLAVAAKVIFDGTCARPFRELLSVFARLVENWGGDSIFFDGYLGDVLTRWSWLNVPTLRDQILRSLPGLRIAKARDIELLRQRYAEVPPDSYRKVLDAYSQMPVGRHLDPLRRMVLFEILYGRGARYIINGNGIMAGQFFTSVQPFFFPRVFRRLFAMTPRAGLGFDGLRELWALLPSDLSHARNLEGYAPAWPAEISRVVWFVNTVLRKLAPRAVRDYGDELRQVRWEPERRFDQ